MRWQPRPKPRRTQGMHAWRACTHRLDDGGEHAHAAGVSLALIDQEDRQIELFGHARLVCVVGGWWGRGLEGKWSVLCVCERAKANNKNKQKDTKTQTEGGARTSSERCWPSFCWRSLSSPRPR